MTLQQSERFTIRVSEIINRGEEYATGRVEIQYSATPFSNQEIARRHDSSTHFTIHAYQPCCHAAKISYGMLFY